MQHRVRRRRRASQSGRAALLLCLTILGTAVEAARADTPSAGVLLRRARYALAEGRRDEAAAALRAVRSAEPRTRRGLEAALLLADVELARGDAAAADAALAVAERDFPDGDASAQVLVARGWLAVARLDAPRALRHFGLVEARSNEVHAVELARLGTGWARLIGASTVTEVPDELGALARNARDPVLRIGALLSLARAHDARGDHKRALRKLRALRRLARGTSFADDAELAIGLTQLEMGAPAAARRTFRNVATLAAGPPSPGDGTPLSLRDLRLPPRALVARLALIYASRKEPMGSLASFLVATFDRDARRDAAAALSLADAAIAARKEA